MVGATSARRALWDELGRRLSQLLDAAPELSAEERDRVREYLDHNELGLAFEELDEATRLLARNEARPSSLCSPL